MVNHNKALRVLLVYKTSVYDFGLHGRQDIWSVFQKLFHGILL